MSDANKFNSADGQTIHEIWSAQLPFPEVETMMVPDIITHVAIERAQPDGYHYLHESAAAWHKGRFYVLFANHPEVERNVEDELIRGRVSDDGLHFGPAKVYMAAPQTGACAFNHPVIASSGDTLWGFFTRWEKDVEDPRCEIFNYDETNDSWRSLDANIPTFIPFHPPMKMADGNWIMGGESTWTEAAVAISDGDDWSSWQLVVIPRAEGAELLFPEAALIDQGDRLVAFCRPRHPGAAQVSFSSDYGRTWSPLADSNFPVCPSQPCAGRLSTGQHFLIANHMDAERHLLMIALTAPGERCFSKMLKIRHQAYPMRRLFGGYDTGTQRREDVKSLAGTTTEWSYPSAVECDGKLYITYTQGKEDCAMSIIPISVLHTGV